MKKTRFALIFLGILIALVPNFLSIWGGVKNWIVMLLGLLVAVISYINVHEQQKQK